MLGIHTINHYNKLLFNVVFVGETLWHERYHESKSSRRTTWLTYWQTKPNTTDKIHNSKLAQTTKCKNHKLTLIWSYSYDPLSENEDLRPEQSRICEPTGLLEQILDGSLQRLHTADEAAVNWQKVISTQKHLW